MEFSWFNAYLSAGIEMLSIIKPSKYLPGLYGPLNTFYMGFLFGLLGLALDMMKYSLGN